MGGAQVGRVVLQGAPSECEQEVLSVPLAPCTPHVPLIPPSQPSISRHRSSRARICLGLSPFTAPAPPHRRARGVSVPLAPCTPHVPPIPPSPPSIRRHPSPRARICPGLAPSRHASASTLQATASRRPGDVFHASTPPNPVFPAFHLPASLVSRPHLAFISPGISPSGCLRAGCWTLPPTPALQGGGRPRWPPGQRPGGVRGQHTMRLAQELGTLRRSGRCAMRRRGSHYKCCRPASAHSASAPALSGHSHAGGPA